MYPINLYLGRLSADFFQTQFKTLVLIRGLRKILKFLINPTILDFIAQKPIPSVIT